MTLHEFNLKATEERARLVWQYGRYIIKRHNENRKFNLALYHMEEFFVEVWYSSINNKIILVHGFERKDTLESYLDMIDLADLLRKK